MSTRFKKVLIIVATLGVIAAIAACGGTPQPPQTAQPRPQATQRPIIQPTQRPTVQAAPQQNFSQYKQEKYKAGETISSVIPKGCLAAEKPTVTFKIKQIEMLTIIAEDGSKLDLGGELQITCLDGTTLTMFKFAAGSLNEQTATIYNYYPLKE